MPRHPEVVHDVDVTPERPLGRAEVLGPARSRSREALGVAVVEVDDTHALVRVDGRLSIATVDRLIGALVDLLAGGQRHVRLDLSVLREATPTALRALVRVHRQFIDSHGLLVVDAGPNLRWRLAAAGVDRVLFVTDPAPARRGTPGQSRQDRL